jgi:ribosomal protein L35
MKTKKIFTKRLKVSKNGKITARVPGQNHFNAKESSSGRMARRRNVALNLSKRVLHKEIGI